MGVSIALVLLLATYAAAVENNPSLQGVLSNEDRQRFTDLFQKAKIDSLENGFYISKGLEILGKSDKVKNEACGFVKDHHSQSKSILDRYFSTSIQSIHSCKFQDKKLANELRAALSDSQNITELYYITTSLTNTGTEVNEDLLSISKLIELTEQDENMMNYARAFLIGALMKNANLKPLMDIVEDVVAQADESPNTIYFEGGLIPTASVVTGIMQLGHNAGARPFISDSQATLLGNYLLSMKYTESLTESFYLLSAINELATNQFITPVELSRVNRKPLNKANKNVEVRLTNIMGTSIKGSQVILESVTDIDGSKNTINKEFTVANDLYSYQLFDLIKGAGHYVMSINTKGKAPVPSLNNVQIPVLVTINVAVSDVTISIIERDQNVALKTASLQYPQTSKDTFNADEHSKVKMTFKISNKDTNDFVTVHQSFIQLISSTGDDIFFVATPTNGVYTFELDVAASAKDLFASKSGKYTMSLIVGGVIVGNPFTWNIGSLNLKFPEVHTEDISDDVKYQYKPKPVINHMFAVPEKRPPAVISTTFSILVVLPLLLLLPIWLILGANISKIGLSGPWAPLFHAGLAGIFMLYYCFWVNLNMFQTLKYLSVIGAVTFIAGNRVLSRIAKC